MTSDDHDFIDSHIRKMDEEQREFYPMIDSLAKQDEEFIRDASIIAQKMKIEIDVERRYIDSTFVLPKSVSRYILHFTSPKTATGHYIKRSHNANSVPEMRTILDSFYQGFQMQSAIIRRAACVLEEGEMSLGESESPREPFMDHGASHKKCPNCGRTWGIVNEGNNLRCGVCGHGYDGKG